MQYRFDQPIPPTKQKNGHQMVSVLLFGAGNRGLNENPRGRGLCNRVLLLRKVGHGVAIAMQVRQTNYPHKQKRNNRCDFFFVGAGNRGQNKNPRGRGLCNRVLLLRKAGHGVAIAIQVRVANYPHKQKRNRRCDFFFVGAGNRGRTCTNEHKILNLARLPIPPYPRGVERSMAEFFCTYPRGDERGMAEFFCTYPLIRLRLFALPKSTPYYTMF